MKNIFERYYSRFSLLHLYSKKVSLLGKSKEEPWLVG